MLKDTFRLLRPHQWTKNGILLAGLIFSGSAGDWPKTVTVFLATGLFCLISSAVYVINDIIDADADRHHPQKAARPIAAGRIKPAAAVVLAIIMAAAALVGAYLLHLGLFIAACAYLALNLFYSAILKHVVIIDVMTIAVGFVLRALAGAMVIEVRFSGWLLVTSFLLALLLGLGKRRHELLFLDETGAEHRRILARYSDRYLDQLIGIVTPAVLVCYLLYVISPEVSVRLGTEYLWLTIPFVMYGIFRYLYLVYQQNQGGSPARLLLTDRPLLLTISLWLLAALFLIYYL